VFRSEITNSPWFVNQKIWEVCKKSMGLWGIYACPDDCAWRTKILWPIQPYANERERHSICSKSECILALRMPLQLGNSWSLRDFLEMISETVLNFARGYTIGKQADFTRDAYKSSVLLLETLCCENHTQQITLRHGVLEAAPQASFTIFTKAAQRLRQKTFVLAEQICCLQTTFKLVLLNEKSQQENTGHVDGSPSHSAREERHGP